MSTRPALDRPPATWTAAGVILIVKAALGLWGGLVLLATSHRRRLSFLGARVASRHAGAGVLLLVLAAVTVAVAVGLLQARPWARVGGIALEALAIVVAVARIGRRPGAAVLSIVLSAVVIGLLAPVVTRPARP